MNFVSYETAVRLKEAGFPQPISKPWQIWYNTNPQKSAVLEMVDSSFFYPIPDTLFIIPEGERLAINDQCVFAPCADDILRELGSEWDLSFTSKLDFSFKSDFDIEHKATFYVYSIAFVKDFCFYHENPAEAAALAWFEMNEK